MTTDELINSPLADWIVECEDEQDIVIGTIGRLVRNLPGYRFPGWSTAEDRCAVSEILLPALRGLRGFKNAYSCEMKALSYEQRRALMVRKQLTPCMAARQDGCHLIIPDKRDLVCMVNEEEHLVIHACRAGNSIRETINELRKLASALESKVSFAQDSRNGYLTSMPGEAGDGIQIYTVLHLPGLAISNMMPQVTKAMEKLHINISPYYSDGEDDTGNLFIIYSIPGPKDSTEELMTHYRNVLKLLVNRELQLRAKLAEDPGLVLADKVARAYATLGHARRISLRESRNAISVLRLGYLLGMLNWNGNVSTTATIWQLRQLDMMLALNTAMRKPEEEEAQPIHRARAARDFLASNSAGLSVQFS